MKENITADEVLSKEKKPKMKSGKKGGHVKEMHIRKADKGGFITQHKEEMGEGKEMEAKMHEHVHPDLDSVHDLLEEKLGQPNEGEESEPPAPPAPVSGGAPPAPVVA